ncbi:MAG: TonB-dependent siderophore receptor [Chlorogloeopsis fritschii C42_A2020_084]|uniref:TonB-dependent siderophore receptor n=1 Tax=Chlorogloeopsis fritschii TaxID=1124 RepID=UPI0019E15A29|nr:TonB-dependent siderophore receptor [Chlorogloeopsis fritschii]MBF2007445.1 TonB-dependent siderophore receptor [Chlorogloeopsis fritschii C42_A2020_084]
MVNLLQLRRSLLLAGVFFILGVQATWAKDTNSSSNAQILVQSPIPTSEIIPVTGVKANPTTKGVEIILETPLGEQLQVTNRSTENNFIADIPNAQLRLPNGNAFNFRSEKPIAGITEITVTNVNENTVQVTVIGENALPTVELFDGDEGLIFAVASTEAATQPPQTAQLEEQPASETPPEEATAQQDQPIELVVTGEQDGYRVQAGTTATKTDTPLRDIPQSIQVVPRQVIEDQKANRLGDALRNVSGVITTTGRAQEGDGVIIRGFGGPFGSLDSFRRNGLKDGIGPSILADPINIDRIEVLKGPASVLFGQGSPGGTVNIITKQPLPEPFYQIEGTIGNFDFYRGTLDFSGPLNEQRTVLYRLNAAAQTSGSFIDFFDEQRYFISPTLSFLFGDRTKLTLETEYQDTTSPGYFGLPALGTVIENPNGKIPLSRFTGEPSESDYNIRVFRVGYDFEHNFNDQWQIRNAFRASFRNFSGLQIGLSGVEDDNRTFNRFYFDNLEDFAVKNYVLDTYTVGKFTTGNIQHQLVIGFDLSREQTRTDGIFGSLAPLDLFNPVYGQPLGAGDPLKSLQNNDALGIYLQDQITLADNLKFLIGGRFDIRSSKLEDEIAASVTFQQDEAFSPRLGIVYQPIPPISLYASYSRSFQQVTGTTFDNRLFQPERGTQYEIGIKADLTDRLSATLALYDLTRSNVLTSDPNNSLFSVQTGKQRSRGVELDISGEISPGWNIITGYAYTDARILEDNSFDVGNRLENAPEHSFNFWTTYQIQQGSLRGLGFGLGLFFVGERQGNLGNTFSLPSYLRTDASIFYKRDRFNAAINIKNLFDIDYFATAINQFRVYPGDPFTVQGTISWEF